MALTKIARNKLISLHKSLMDSEDIIEIIGKMEAWKMLQMSLSLEDRERLNKLKEKKG